MEYENDGDNDYNWCTWNSSWGINNEIGRHGNKKTSGDHPDYNIVKIGQNIEKNLGDLKRLTVTQTPVGN